MKSKIIAVLSLFALVAVGGLFYPSIHSFAQNTGLVTVVGQTNAVNQFAPSSATGIAGAVTNPSSNFVVQVAGGPVYFNGSIQTIGQTQLTLPASSTNLIVWNGTTEAVYAKQAVTGPGSSGTSVGVPGTVLYAIPGQEVALATVVCNGTACGNGGNGSITDSRALGNFPLGTYMAGHVNQAAAGTAAAGSFAGTATLASGTVTVTFSNAFQSAPVCIASPSTSGTFTTGAKLTVAPTTANVVIASSTGTDTAVVDWACFGNPN